MSYGLAVYSENREVLFTQGVFRAIWAVTLNKTDTTTYSITLPAGEGTLSYTTTLDRNVDQIITGSGQYCGIVDVTFSGNTANVSTLRSTDNRFGFLKETMHLTFYRSRP